MQGKSNKPKTIQIQYPAPYSQSWTDDKPKAPSNTKRKSYDIFGLVKKNPPLVRSDAAPKEKVYKREKNRGPMNVTQIVYPFSPFKTLARHTERRVTKIRKNAMVSHRPSQKVNRAIDPYKSWPPPPPTTRPDPTAPHLKYGVFKSPKDKPIAIKAPTTQPLRTPHKAHRTLSMERANKKKHKVPKGTACQDQGDSSQGAVQVTRQLTISPPNHMDITPREALRK